MTLRNGLSIALLLSVATPTAAVPPPDLVTAAEAGHPPSFEDVLRARFDAPDHAGFDRLRQWAERPTPAERKHFMVKIGPGADDTATWRDRTPCWQADLKGATRAMTVAVGGASDPIVARRIWAEAERVSASIPRIEADMIVKAKREAAGQATAIAKALAIRHATDQAWRVAQFAEPHDDVTAEAITWRVWSAGCHIDADNLAYIKRIFARGRWPLISRDGAAAARYAFLLVQHADDDRDFQQRVLTLLEGLVARKEAAGKYYALLFDRVAVGQGHLQRYGTQFGGEKGCLAVQPVEDHATLDARRASVGLAPLHAYASELSGTYHQPLCDDLFASAGTKP